MAEEVYVSLLKTNKTNLTNFDTFKRGNKAWFLQGKRGIPLISKRYKKKETK